MSPNGFCHSKRGYALRLSRNSQPPRPHIPSHIELLPAKSPHFPAPGFLFTSFPARARRFHTQVFSQRNFKSSPCHPQICAWGAQGAPTGKGCPCARCPPGGAHRVRHPPLCRPVAGAVHALPPPEAARVTVQGLCHTHFLPQPREKEVPGAEGPSVSSQNKIQSGIWSSSSSLVPLALLLPAPTSTGAPAGAQQTEPAAWARGARAPRGRHPFPEQPHPPGGHPRHLHLLP